MSVIAIRFPEPYATLSVRPEVQVAFEKDPLGWFWADPNPERQEDKAWLDANAPGWECGFQIVSMREHEIPVGAEASGYFISIKVKLGFAHAAHRQAWRARIAEKIKEARARKKRAKERKAHSATPELVCPSCGGDMVPFVKTETSRVAQFAFTYDLRGRSCSDCGSHIYKFDCNVPTDEAAAFVGLPNFKSPLWNDEFKSEWARRRNSDPEISIRIEPGMTPDTVIELLKAELATKGRRVGRPALSLIRGSPST